MIAHLFNDIYLVQRVTFYTFAARLRHEQEIVGCRYLSRAMSSNFWASSHSRYWLVTRSHLHQSRALDLEHATPRQLYCLGIWFANLIQKLGKRLLLRQVPIATATVFFRRFYLKNSYCETNPYLVLAACCFVAAKVEETPVHIKSVVQEAKLVFAGEPRAVRR